MDIERLAERARALLSDDLLREVTNEIRQDAEMRLTNCDPHNIAELQKAALDLEAANRFTTALWHRVQSLEIEQKKGRHRG